MSVPTPEERAALLRWQRSFSDTWTGAQIEEFDALGNDKAAQLQFFINHPELGSEPGGER